MKCTKFGPSVLLLLVSLYACKNNTIPYTQDGDWIRRSSFNGASRSEAVSFTIGNFAYLAGGVDGQNKRYNDMWQFDPSGNGNWSQMANMPAVNNSSKSTARSSAVGFSVNGMGYLGTGYDGYNYMNDFWQFDPIKNAWMQKADFPGGPRYEAAAFGIGNYGYVTTGYDGLNAQKDFYRYDPSSDQWIAKTSMGGDKRYSAVTFVYNNRAYLVTGVNSGTAVSDFWRYDPLQPDSSSWSELNHITNFSTASFDDGYTNIVRWNASAFVIAGASDTATYPDRAFITTGENGQLYTYTWQYIFRDDTWKPKTPFAGVPRTGAVGMTVQNRGYIATGRTSTQALDDVGEFKPDAVFNINDFSGN